MDLGLAGKLKARWRRPVLKTLDRYVLKRFFTIYVANLLCFTMIFVLIDSVTHFEDFLRNRVGLLSGLEIWLRYYASILPVIFCQVLGPVVSVSAALFAVTTLQRTNEFTPILASGRSYQRTLLPVLLASLFVSVGVFLIQDLWIPRTASSLRRAAESRDSSAIEKNVKHFDRAEGNLVVFREYEPYRRRGTGVLVLPVFRTGAHRFLIHARSAEWREPARSREGTLEGYWLLRDGSVQEWDGDYRLVIHPPPPEWPSAPPELYETFLERPLQTSIIPQDLEKQETVHMSLSDLRRKAETSADQGVWKIRYYSRFAYALTNFTLVLLGLPVIVFFANRNLIFGALLAVAISTAYFVVNSVLQDLGIQGHIPAALGGGLATIIFLALGATLFRHMST